jgi:LytS/YehU family sensor histidine kinase
VRDVAVPPLFLQPLVENAVHHGVAHLLGAWS